jgi:small subunit ribosomal protein S21
MKRHNKASQESLIIKGISVEVRNGDVNFALRKFKRKVQEAGLMQELREREFYTKPSEKRKRAKAAARSRWLKKETKTDENTSQSNS